MWTQRHKGTTGEDWNYVATSQGTARNLKRGLERECGPPDSLILDFQLPELEDNNFLFFKPFGLWY